MQQKHKVSTVKELIEIKESIQKQIDVITSYDFETDKLKKQVEKLYNELSKLAKEISGNRNAIIPKIENKVVEILQQLGIPNAAFKIEQIESEESVDDRNEALSG